MKSPATLDRNLIITLSLSNSLCSFIILPALYLRVTDKVFLEGIRPDYRLQLPSLLLTSIALIALVPFMGVLIRFNQEIEFPVALSGWEKSLRLMEEGSRQITNRLLSFEHMPERMLAILTMAVVPGIAEEFLFRGIVQRQLQYVFKNDHYAILLASALFSFFHFQFFGFFPRLVLGIVLGYIFVWSANIWYPIAAHIMNNVLAILLYLFPISKPIESASYFPILLPLFSLAVAALLFFFLKQQLSKVSH